MTAKTRQFAAFLLSLNVFANTHIYLPQILLLVLYILKWFVDGLAGLWALATDIPRAPTAILLFSAFRMPWITGENHRIAVIQAFLGTSMMMRTPSVLSSRLQVATAPVLRKMDSVRSMEL